MVTLGCELPPKRRGRWSGLRPQAKGSKRRADAPKRETAGVARAPRSGAVVPGSHGCSAITRLRHAAPPVSCCNRLRSPRASTRLQLRYGSRPRAAETGCAPQKYHSACASPAGPSDGMGGDCDRWPGAPFWSVVPVHGPKKLPLTGHPWAAVPPRSRGSTHASSHAPTRSAVGRALRVGFRSWLRRSAIESPPYELDWVGWHGCMRWR